MAFFLKPFPSSLKNNLHCDIYGYSDNGNDSEQLEKKPVGCGLGKIFQFDLLHDTIP